MLKVYHTHTHTHTHTHLSDQPEGAVEAAGVRVLAHFVVQPSQLGQPAARVPQGLTQHHLSEVRGHSHSRVQR